MSTWQGVSVWWSDTSVPKNVKNNLTIFALDDLIFKVEVHILHGSFVPYAPLFKNTSSSEILQPSQFPSRQPQHYHAPAV